MYMISATGRSPVIAAPTAAPSTPASAIGVSMTRAGKRAWSPRVAPYTPPASPTSTPSSATRSSRSISSASARLSASRSLGIDVLEHRGGLGIRRGQRRLHGGVHLLLRGAHDGVCGGVVAQREAGGAQRVARGELDPLPLGAVALGVALEVPAQARRVRLHEARPAAAAGGRPR